MEKRLEETLKTENYDYVILLGGLNDLGNFNVNENTIEKITETFKNI